MSRFACRCGYEIRDIQCPTRHTAYLVTDTEIDNHPNMTPEPGNSRGVMECPECKRIWIQVTPWENRYIPFSPDGEALDLAVQQGGYRG